MGLVAPGEMTKKRWKSTIMASGDSRWTPLVKELMSKVVLLSLLVGKDSKCIFSLETSTYCHSLQVGIAAEGVKACLPVLPVTYLSRGKHA